MIKRTNDERDEDRDREAAVLAEFAFADSDEAGQAFQYEAGHPFRDEAGHGSDLKSATWRSLRGSWR